MKNIINKDDLKIRLCTSKDVKDIYELQNIVIDFFKEDEKGYFLPFKEESYLRIVNVPINDGEIYGAFVKDKIKHPSYIEKEISYLNECLDKSIDNNECFSDVFNSLIDKIIVHKQEKNKIRDII